VEVKKIAVGRYADSIFHVMQELGVTKHIGLRVMISIFSSDVVHIVHCSIFMQMLWQRLMSSWLWQMYENRSKKLKKNVFLN